MTTHRVLWLTGLPGVGKLTVARQLSVLTGWPTFHNHLAVDAAAALFPFGSEGFCELRAAVWRAGFSAATTRNQPFIFTFSPERSVPEALVTELRGITRAAGGRTQSVELRCSAEALRGRLEGTERKPFGKLRDPALFARLEAEGVFAEPAMPSPDLVLETTTLSAEAAAQVIVEALRLPRAG